MSVREQKAGDLRHRLDRIESARHVGAPNRVMADYPIEDDEADRYATEQ